MCGFGLAIFRITSASTPEAHHQSGEFFGQHASAHVHSGALDAPKDFMSPDERVSLDCPVAPNQDFETRLKIPVSYAPGVACSTPILRRV